MLSSNTEHDLTDEYAAIMAIDKNTAYLIQQVSQLSETQVLTNNLLTILIKGGKVEEIGGYVYGSTSTGDVFIILYPAKEVLLHKICRVYPERFHLLPQFIPTVGIPNNGPENNPDKTAAKRQNIYHQCQPFTIGTEPGKETNMGNEVRFLMTVDASGSTAAKRIVDNFVQQVEKETEAHNPATHNKTTTAENSHKSEPDQPLSQEDTNMNVDQLNEMLGLGQEPNTYIPYDGPDTKTEPDEPKTPDNLTRRDLPFNPDQPKPEDDVLIEPYKYGDGTLLSTKSATLTITYKAYFDVHRKIPPNGLSLKQWYDKNREFLNTTYKLPLPTQ